MRVLMVSIAAPPKNDPESLQVGKYIKHLSKEVDLDLVTSASPTLWMKKDDTLLNLVENVKQTIELPIWEPKFLSIIGNKFFRKFFKPDTRYTFHKQDDKVFSSLENEPDLIYSRSFPLSSTLMAYKLKKKYNVPWILHLSDPWVESPLFNYNKSSYHRKQEKRCLHEADVISFTSENTLDLYVKKFPELKDKFVIFPNVYDELPDNDKAEIIEDKFFKLVYTGSLTGSRDLSLFAELYKEKYSDQLRELLKDLKIDIAGNIDSRSQKILDAMPDWVNYHGFVSLDEAKTLQKQANLLIAIDFNFKKKEDGVYFPSKLLDYFTTQKQILAITTEGSSTDRVLSQIEGHLISYHNDVESLIENLKKAKRSIGVLCPIPKKYEAKHNVERLVKTMKELC